MNRGKYPVKKYSDSCTDKMRLENYEPLTASSNAIRKNDLSPGGSVCFTPSDGLGVQPRSKTDCASSSSSTASSSYSTQNKQRHSKSVYLWTNDDVLRWLKKFCPKIHSAYSELFRQHDISGRSLMRLNEIKLELMGITNHEHRQEIRHQILRLRLKYETLELKNLKKNSRRDSN